MKRYGGVCRVKEGCLDKYKEYHAAVWSKVLEKIYLCNIRNYVIYYDSNTRCLFFHYEYIGDDYERDMKAMADDEITRKWWSVNEPLMEPFNYSGPPPSQGGKGGNWFEPLEEVFICGHEPTGYN